MKPMMSLLPVAAVAAGSLLAVAALSSSPSAAQSCARDAGGGCQTDGKACSPPAGGRCYTVKERRVLNCVCATKKPPNALRGSERPLRSRPGDRGSEPTEEQEPQEPQG